MASLEEQTYRNKCDVVNRMSHDMMIKYITYPKTPQEKMTWESDMTAADAELRNAMRDMHESWLIWFRGGELTH